MTDYRVYELSLSEKTVFYLGGYLGFACLGYIFYKSIILSLLLGFCILLFRKRYVSLLRDRRKEKLLLGFKDLLYSLSASVSSGRSVAEGLSDGLESMKHTYKPDSDIILELENICEGINVRMENDAEALSDFAQRADLEDIRDFTDVYITVRSTGGDLESVIERTSTILLDKMTIDREIRMVVSQKKLESKIIALMPIAVIAGMNLTAASYLEPMYETAQGRVIMTLALAGIGISYILISKITEIRV